MIKRLEIVRRRLVPGIRPEWAAGQPQGHDVGEAGKRRQEIDWRAVAALSEYNLNLQKVDRGALAQDRVSLAMLRQMLEH